MATSPTRPKTAEQVIAQLRRRQRSIVDAYVHELVPSYDQHQARLQEVREAGELVIGMLLRAMSEGRAISPEEFAFTRGYLRRAFLRGATEQELIRSARAWQRVVFDEMQVVAGPDGGAALADLSRVLIEHVDALSDMATEVLGEISAALRLTERDGRAELLEELLAGRGAAPARLGALHAFGLGDATALMVVSARPVAPLPDPAAAAVAAVTLAHAPGDAVEPLFAVRGDEVVIVRATPDEPARAVAALREAQRRLERDGVGLAVGVSAVHPGVDAVPAACEEASMARERVAGSGGVLAIALLDPLGYLFVKAADDTAWRLVDPGIRSFIEADLAQAGLLIETLDAYVSASLNVKLAAERLFVHPNTAHYRLAKIEELTGRDLRALEQLQELIVAVRLARMRERDRT